MHHDPDPSCLGSGFNMRMNSYDRIKREGEEIIFNFPAGIGRKDYGCLNPQWEITGGVKNHQPGYFAGLRDDGEAVCGQIRASRAKPIARPNSGIAGPSLALMGQNSGGQVLH